MFCGETENLLFGYLVRVLCQQYFKTSNVSLNLDILKILKLSKPNVFWKTIHQFPVNFSNTRMKTRYNTYDIVCVVAELQKYVKKKQ